MRLRLWSEDSANCETGRCYPNVRLSGRFPISLTGTTLLILFPPPQEGQSEGEGHRAFPGLKFQNQMFRSRASVGKCLAFHSMLRAQWSLRATSIQRHIWFWLYLATEEQPRGPEGQLSAGSCLGWLGRSHSVRSAGWRDCSSSADVFHGRRSKQPSPSHLELTAESVGCLHTLRHGCSLRVQGWSAPDHWHRDQHLLQRTLGHTVPLPGTIKTTEIYNLRWLSKKLTKFTHSLVLG